MQILIYGFQRSGTTLLRRLIHLHPDVKRMFHERAVLKRLDGNPKMLRIYLREMGVNIKIDNWGDKVPYYKTAKEKNPVEYCEKWLEVFKRKGKIIHIIRHPYDTAFSIVKKYKGIKAIHGPLKIYRSIVPQVLKVLEDNESVLNIKYEDLLNDSDKMMYKIYDFCGLDPNIDYKKEMKKIQNPIYRTINPKRSFAYKTKEFKTDINLENVITILNKIDGVKYET